MSTLSNKVVFITGAARGIGAETARALAARGCRLVLTDVDAVPLQELQIELGAVAVTVVADVR
ncbi:MAG: SDR family NAD(P)-dependent oxidoreductase, partial [Rhodococcus sp. (in: high G+C Gram-positive bacteria)]